MPVERVLLAEPRGFCAGVEKAIKALAWMVAIFEPPVYCYHEIVHNQRVVEAFRELGVIFVDDVAAVFEAALDGEWNGVFNVAAPHPVSLRQLAEEIGRIIGVEPRFTPSGAATAPRIVPELARLAEHYDLSQFRPLAVGLAEAVA